MEVSAQNAVAEPSGSGAEGKAKRKRKADSSSPEKEPATAAPVDVAVAAADESSPAESPPKGIQRDPNVYASAVLLMQRSPRHRHLFIADLEWSLLPPLALGQARLFHKDGLPVAFATWAFVSEEVEERLQQGQMRLKPGEWKSGDSCWLIDLVSPGGGAKELLRTLRQDVLPGQRIKYLAREPESGDMKVFEVE